MNEINYLLYLNINLVNILKLKLYVFNRNRNK